MASIFQEVKDTLTTNLVKRNVGTYMGPGSVLSEYTSAFALEVSKLTEEYLKTEKSTRISEATGMALDRIGQELQEPRIQATPAQFRAVDRVVKIETANGLSFLENNISDLTPGLRLFSDDSTEFIVTETFLFTSTSSEVYVGARATRAGSYGNLLKGSLIRHSSPIYRDVLIVNQIHSIYNGVDRETDEAYLSRLENSFLAKRLGSVYLVEEAIRKIPGIEKFQIINQSNGLGTLLAIVQPKLGYYVYPSSINEMFVNINNIMELGSRVEIRNPNLYEVRIKSVIKTNSILNTTEKEQLKMKIKRALLARLNGVQIGESLSLLELSDIIKSTDPRITSFGNSSRLLDVVFIKFKDGDYEFEEAFESSSSSAVSVDVGCLLIPDESNPFEFEIV